MNRRTVASAVSLSLLLLSFAAAMPAVAADPDEVTWSVKPSAADGPDGRLYFDYSIDPGTQINDYVAVSNEGVASETFTLYGTDAVNDYETGGFGLLPAETKPTDIGSWVTVSQPTVTVEPGHQARIPFTLVIPSDASPGDHSAGVVASVVSDSTDSKGQAVKLDLRVAARIYLRISGALSPALSVSGLVTSFTPSLNPFGPGTATVDYAVSNTGNVRVDATQTIRASGLFGIPLGGAAAAPITNILPGQSVHVRQVVDGVGAAGLVWGAVTLKPSAAGGVNAVGASIKGGAPPATPATGTDGDPTAAGTDVAYKRVTSDSVSLAVSWTLLTLVLLVILAVYFILRWMSRTRSTFYDAVDAAVAEADRERTNKDAVGAGVE